jgi:hypothetical protein
MAEKLISGAKSEGLSDAEKSQLIHCSMTNAKI